MPPSKHRSARLTAPLIWSATLLCATLSACFGGGEGDDAAASKRSRTGEALPPASGPDADGDGLSDEEEAQAGTDPTQRDSDGDGKPDGVEVKIYGTDPLKLDTDGDGVGDGAELASGTDPKNPGDAQGTTVGPDGVPFDPNAPPVPGPDGVPNGEGTSSAPASTTPAGTAPAAPGLPPLGPAWTPSPISTPDGKLSPSWDCSTPGFGVLYVQSSGCFLPVRGGSFVMGAQSKDPSAPGYEAHAAADEGPPHKVTVSSFWLQQDEVTAMAYRYCIAAGVCSLDDVIAPGPMNAITNADLNGLPANGVTWKGAERYCSWLGARLPTEAEWEFAARGPDNLAWPWGPDAWCGVSGPAPGAPPVPTEPDWTCQGESFVSNERVALRGPFRHRALVGNLWEWVADWYDPRAYTPSASTDPTGPKAGKNRVQRGGSWMTPLVWDRRPTARSQAPAEQKLPDVGFRCAWRGPVP